jgi:hypothetical protein
MPFNRPKSASFGGLAGSVNRRSSSPFCTMNIGFSRGFWHADDHVSKTKLGNTIGAAESKASRTKKKKCGPLLYKVLVATVNDWPVYCRLPAPKAFATRRNVGKHWATYPANLCPFRCGGAASHSRPRRTILPNESGNSKGFCDNRLPASRTPGQTGLLGRTLR